MNIVIDQGNTSAKIALFEGKDLIELFRFRPLRRKDLLELLAFFTPDRGILSAVGKIDPALVRIMEERIPYFAVLDEHTPLPIKVEYRTPATLGKDRIAAVVGAYTLRPDNDILVIDIGTAITYDFIDRDGNYKGGNISPGMTARFKALHQYTRQLPMVDEEGDLPELGYDTLTAIRSGVIHGITMELDTYIREYKKKHNVLTFLTGGHSFYFADKLKRLIFADGNLVLKGLNEILTYQDA